jgi:hypothetical protein
MDETRDGRAHRRVDVAVLADVNLQRPIDPAAAAVAMPPSRGRSRRLEAARRRTARARFAFDGSNAV